MLEGHEAVSAILGLVMIAFIVVNRGKLGTASHPRVLIASFGLFAASLFCSAIEGLFWEDILDFFQHVLAPASLVLLAIWSWLTCVHEDGASA